jgi:hypothetical protein
MSWQTSLADISGMATDGTNIYVLATHTSTSNYGVHIVNTVTGSIQDNFIPASNIKTQQGNQIGDPNSWPNRSLGIDDSYVYILYSGFYVKRFSKVDGTSSGTDLFNAQFNNEASNIGALYGMSVDRVQNKLYISATDRGYILQVDLLSSSLSRTEIPPPHNLTSPAGSYVTNNTLYCVDRDAGVIYSYGPLNGSPSLSLSAFPSVPIGSGSKTSYSLTSDGTALYIGNDTASASGVITKIKLADGSYTNLAQTATRSIFGLAVVGTKIYASLNSNGLFSTDTFIPNTPVYLGNATISTTGDFNLAGTVLSTSRFPSDPHELVPRAYVDNYVGSVVSYFTDILDPNNSSEGTMSVLERISYLEAQLERVYKVLWNVNRDVTAIVTPQLGSVAADYEGASNDNDDLIANPPQAPATLSGFQ